MCRVHDGDDELSRVAEPRDGIRFVVRDLHNRRTSFPLTSYLRAGHWHGETAICCPSSCFRSVHLLSPFPSCYPFKQFSPQMTFTATLAVPYGTSTVLLTSY